MFERLEMAKHINKQNTLQMLYYFVSTAKYELASLVKANAYSFVLVLSAL